MRSSSTSLRSAALVAMSVVILVASGCSTARVDERITYWKAETDAHLKIGTSRHDAEAFFTARSATLKCCVSGPLGPMQHYALERNVGRFLWTEYDVAVLVDFSPAEEVRAVHVQRWGVGF